MLNQTLNVSYGKGFSLLIHNQHQNHRYPLYNKQL